MSATDGIYRGWNVHGYTDQFRAVIPTTNFLHRVDSLPFLATLEEIRQRYGNRLALCSMRTHFKAGRIQDPDLPSVNVALVLLALWRLIKRIDHPSIYEHFSETLNQIGATCIQGMSHRLLADWVALSREQRDIGASDSQKGK